MGCCNLKQDLNVIFYIIYQKFNYNINIEKLSNTNSFIESEEINIFNFKTLNNFTKKNNLTSRNNHATQSTLFTDSLCLTNNNNLINKNKIKNKNNEKNLKVNDYEKNINLISNQNKDKQNIYEKFKDVFDEEKIIKQSYLYKKCSTYNNSETNDITDLKINNNINIIENNRNIYKFKKYKI